MIVPYKVLLPKWIFETVSKKEQYSLAIDYMQRYPHYAVISVENGYAICERRINKENGGSDIGNMV